jgi:hypothetical protein
MSSLEKFSTFKHSEKSLFKPFTKRNQFSHTFVPFNPEVSGVFVPPPPQHLSNLDTLGPFSPSTFPSFVSFSGDIQISNDTEINKNLYDSSRLNRFNPLPPVPRFDAIGQLWGMHKPHFDELTPPK